MTDGYDDTPFLPGGKWRIHDRDRPVPPIVSPGSFSSQESQGSPPDDAVVLFDGSNLDAWVSVRGGTAGWKLVAGNSMETVRGTGDIRTKREFGSCQLHLEWKAPTAISASGQGRGNSGVFLLGLYEVQILDNFENPTYADGLAGAIYGQFPPLVNACLPPGVWQTFDIVFETPEYESGHLKNPATMTLFHNGVVAHLRQSMQGPTKHRALADYQTAHGPKGPIVLQDHGDPVQFRNIWIRELAAMQAE
ncbi:MAG: DUF1080 domain-containing protein [Gammaproteobacteria bacterium]|nr:DUF1080 domain-containing protein [Gammaproteobacteria bacterium]